MWHRTRLSAIEALRPASYDDRRALYELVRDGLLESGTLDGEIARCLSLVLVGHLAGDGGRVLLRGAPGAGKTAIARSVASAADLPLLEIDAGMLAEMNWSGADLAFFLQRLYDDLRQAYPPHAVPMIAEHACVFIHSLDSVRVPGTYTGTEATRDHREGKQQGLAALCSGGAIPVSTGPGSGHVWRGGAALRIVSAEFDGLRAGQPDAEALISWGLTPSLARALAVFSFFELPPVSPAWIGGAVLRGVRSLQERFLAFGFHLEVTDQVIRYVTHALSSGRNTGGPIAASQWIAQAAEAALIRLLEEGAPVGARFTLARDDVTLPEPARGIWRE